MKKLYYTVTPESYPNGVSTGYRTIKVYRMFVNQPQAFCTIKAMSRDTGRGIERDEVEIQTWLDHNGHQDSMFKFIKL